MNLLVQYFPSCAKTICMENRSDILGLLMLQKEWKTYFGTALLVGLRKVSSPLLWWPQCLQSWQHLWKQASSADSIMGHTARVMFSGGANPAPFLHGWLAQGCRMVAGRIWVWATPAPVWPYMPDMWPRGSWGIGGTISLSHFRPAQCTLFSQCSKTWD